VSPQQIEIAATAAKMLVWIGFLVGALTPVMVWVERRGSALIQDRPGPNRLGPFGLFQPVADVVKFMFKESPVPAAADPFLYRLAPVLALVAPLSTYLVIPLAPRFVVAGQPIAGVAADVDTGVLLLLALSSLGVYSLVMAGYASNNKYSMLGSVRASAQMISYELALTLSVVAVLVPVGSLRLDEVVAHQQTSLLHWNVFPQAIGFLVFLVAMFAETNRLPFDLPEAESELVAGYHTEYSAMRFALFFMGEYMAMGGLSALCATLYFGGWSLPGVDVMAVGAWLAGLPGLGWLGGGILGALVGALILFAKVVVMMLVYVWVRWTFPRFRFDQLMRLGWKVLLPLALLNLVLVAALTVGGVL